MAQEFDKEYWESHWQQAIQHGTGWEVVENPFLVREARNLTPGMALEAGCGEGAEAIWLAAEGWQVTAIDISAEVLSRACERAKNGGLPPGRIQWVQADLSVWEPGRQFDLVSSHYAHPAIPQLAFYERISRWVAPGGTLLIVGHLDTSGTSGDGHRHRPARHGHYPTEEATVTAASVAERLDTTQWRRVTTKEHARTVKGGAGRTTHLEDVVVCATRV